MRKKTLIILSVILATMILLVSCGNSNNGDNKESSKVAQTNADQTDVDQSIAESSDTDQAEDSGKKKVAIVLPMDHLAMNASRDGIIEELEKAFGEDGVEIIVKNANGDSSLLNSILSEVIGADVDMIMPIATGPSQIAATSTSDIPIVFSAVTDPVEAGLTKSWDEADKNVTGVSDMADIEAIIDFAIELYPDAKTFGIVYNSAEVNSIVQVELAKQILDEKGLNYKEGTITNTSELQQVVENLAESVDAFYSPTDNDVASAIPIFQQVANKYNLAIFPGASTMVEAGGTGTVGLDYYDLGLQAGRMAVRILNGESIADNPPETVKEVTKILNKDQVDALGIEIPEALKSEIEFVETQEQ